MFKDVFKKKSQGSKNIINSNPSNFLVCAHPNLKNTIEEMLVSELTKLS